MPWQQATRSAVIGATCYKAGDVINDPVDRTGGKGPWVLFTPEGAVGPTKDPSVPHIKGAASPTVYMDAQGRKLHSSADLVDRASAPVAMTAEQAIEAGASSQTEADARESDASDGELGDLLGAE